MEGDEGCSCDCCECDMYKSCPDDSDTVLSDSFLRSFSGSIVGCKGACRLGDLRSGGECRLDGSSSTLGRVHDGSNDDGVGSKRKLPRRRRRGSSEGTESSSKAKMTCRGVWSLVLCVSSQPSSLPPTERPVLASFCGSEIVGGAECSSWEVCCNSSTACAFSLFSSLGATTKSLKSLSVGDCIKPAIDSGDMLT